jgi:transketolase
MRLGEPNLDIFSATLLELARKDADILVVTGDSRGSGRLIPFAEALPDRVVEVGIAEQNLIGMAAGLASAGKKVFAVSPACFLTARALEQIKNDVAYSDQPVKLIGISAGVSYGALGSTHHSLHDYAVLRAINNITIVAPADNFEAREAIKAAAGYAHPIYVRFGKRPMPHVHNATSQFRVGSAIELATGSDVTFIGTGEPVAHALEACEILERQGISCGVVSMHTVKPLDVETLLRVGARSRALITVEEHSVLGGLGEACASVLLQNGVSLPFTIVGIPDEYTVTGSQLDIFRHYGIAAEGLVSAALRLLRRELAR